MMSTIFVTVGSTKFDNLIVTILSPELLNKFHESGFNNVIIQAGKSQIPEYQSGPLKISIYNYKKSILKDALRSDLVICHAGAGTCLEMLRLNKKLIVVVNDTLMDNHQVELAEQLDADDYAVMATINGLTTELDTYLERSQSLVAFPKQTNRFIDILDATFKHVIY